VAVAEKVDCLLLERQYTSLGNKLAIRSKRSASAVITQGAVITPLPTLHRRDLSQIHLVNGLVSICLKIQKTH
jgi:hypothetical protein